MAFRCDGLVYLVTGATSGIGNACCRVLCDAGAKIFAVGRNEAAGDALLQTLDRERVTFHAADLRSKEACISAADAAFQWQGRVDAFVHSAGIFPSASLSDTTDEMWSDCMRVHADAFFYLSRHLAPNMVKNGGGSLLAIASNYGMVGASDAAAYAASKAACIALCKSMALEYAKHNVRVNCVCPGATETPMIADNAKEYAKSSPSRELVQPLDIANAVLYLTSPAGRMIRGIELLVDGGEIAGFHQGQRTQQT